MFWRLSCHFCGKRSKYSKGTTEFQCTDCEARNYYDNNAEVVETPYTQCQAPPTPILLHKPFLAPKAQPHETFCSRCLNNQRIYMESISNYLPDPDEVGYAKYIEYERKLPQYKAKLEQDYPQVCKKCAPRAQEKIRKQDIFGKLQQVAKMSNDTFNRQRRGGSPTGSRDDWVKWTMRFMLSFIGTLRYISLLAQTSWHVYGILAFMFVSTSVRDFDTGFAFDPTFTDCARSTLSMCFDRTCYQRFSTLISKTLLMNLLLLWYHPGIKDGWHDTYRMEAARGTTEHRRIQALLLAVRSVAWYMLSDSTITANLSTQQLLGAHIFMVALMLPVQWASERVIKSVKWKMQGHIMPSVEQADMFGATAGPAIEQYERKASEDPRSRMYPRNDKPFDINSLAPKRNTQRHPQRNTYATGLTSNAYGVARPPTPPDSQYVSDDDEEMTDWRDDSFRPTTYQRQEPMRSTWNYGMAQPSGWGAMRNEIFDIQDQTRADAEVKRKEQEERARLRYQPPVEQSPFRGRLPPAPMSMERRVRNPPTRMVYNPVPVSEQKNFFQQMRDKVENGSTFAKKNDDKHVRFREQESIIDNDEETFSPAKNRTRGQMEFHDSGWRLPGDGMQRTGLEDMFAGKSFSIADEPGIKIAATQMKSSSALPWKLLSLAVPVAVLAVGWNVPPARKGVCLWLVQKIEALGY